MGHWFADQPQVKPKTAHSSFFLRRLAGSPPACSSPLAALALALAFPCASLGLGRTLFSFLFFASFLSFLSFFSLGSKGLQQTRLQSWGVSRWRSQRRKHDWRFQNFEHQKTLPHAGLKAQGFNSPATRPSATWTSFCLSGIMNWTVVARLSIYAWSAQSGTKIPSSSQTSRWRRNWLSR